ncbi:MAG: hypothetical protein JO184_13690 [Gammaproteobacteria bacterium]|nr:hypothetical protein [Gammaproteobacteria bacterium]
MNEPITGTESRRRSLTTADIVASATPEDSGTEAPSPDRMAEGGVAEKQRLACLFTEETAADFRARWNVVQQGFVDDPQNAVRQGDELVAQVIKSLAETFAKQRSALEGDRGSTEELRLALRRYRSFFERLLSI